MEKRKFKLQVVSGISGYPQWVEVYAESASAARRDFWSENPRMNIVATIDMEENREFTGF
jgi:hypothetical protein